MIKVECSGGRVRVPCLLDAFFVTFDGELSDEAGNQLTIDEFNSRTSLGVKNLEVLLAVTFHRFAWPPVYWHALVAHRTVTGEASPENLVLGIEKPVPSLEYSGFYMIPYYSNYVVSPCGRLLKRANGTDVTPSRGILGYYTYRLLDDSGSTMNRLRHRILCYAFKPYAGDVEEMDVNHIDGCPGSDKLDNLEWVTRSENINHAYRLGLRDDNVEVEIKDTVNNRTYIFASCAQASRFFGITVTTVSNRIKTNGYKAFGGYQFRRHPCDQPWPQIDSCEGKYMVTFPNGTTKHCGGEEAARLAGLTRTSFLRAIREGRCRGKTDVTFQKI